ncbi:uncharacterized protein METZ01_LOCUS475316, partial [marine metagenome]
MYISTPSYRWKLNYIATLTLLNMLLLAKNYDLYGGRISPITRIVYLRAIRYHRKCIHL